MLHRTYEGQDCSIARTLEVVGERWTLLIMRDAFLGVRRFDDIQRDLGIARNVLRDRLARLVEEGLLERRPYQERPPRSEYRLTEAGLDLWPSIVALLQWGNRHLPPKPQAVRIAHKSCGEVATFSLTCDCCGERVTARDARAVVELPQRSR
jgi:DNA-binding HxlR family transcriptional regulator